MGRTERMCFSCHTSLKERASVGGVRFADGHRLCGACWESSVDTPITGGQVLADVRRLVTARTGLDFSGITTPLQLLDCIALGNKVIGRCQSTISTLNGHITTREIKAIKILRGLPREHFAATCAHELGHAYMVMNAFPKLDRRTEEGLCELCEYVYLTGERTAISRVRMGRMMRNTDPIYGDGFRAAHRCLGSRRVIDLYTYVKRTRRFPTPGTRW